MGKKTSITGIAIEGGGLVNTPTYILSQDTSFTPDSITLEGTGSHTWTIGGTDANHSGYDYPAKDNNDKDYLYYIEELDENGNPVGENETVAEGVTLKSITYQPALTENAGIKSGLVTVVNEVKESSPETTSVTVQKRWQSNHATWNPSYGQDLTIYFKLYKQKTDGTDKTAVNSTIYQLTKDTKVNVSESNLGEDAALVESKFTKNADNTYSIPFMITIPDLPELETGWEYAVVECNSSGTEFEQGEDKPFWTCLEFKNTTIAIKNDLTDVTATKIWKDQGVKGVAHPAVTFSLYRTIDTIPEGSWKNETGYDHLGNINWGDPIDTETIAENATGDDLTAKWADLPKYDIATGKLYTYYVKESAVEGYQLKSRGLIGGNKYQFTFENELLNKTNFEFSKIWKDISGRPSTWPEDATIKVTLNAYTTESQKAISDIEVTLSKTGSNEATPVWTATTSADGKKTTFKVEDLAKYSNDGKELYYYVIESQVSGYKEPSYQDKDGNGLIFNKGDIVRAIDGQTVVNTPEAGYELPSTGGRGTTFHYILGSILIALAGATLVMRRRKRYTA